MNTLKAMGIQQWQLRSQSDQAVASEKAGLAEHKMPSEVAAMRTGAESSVDVAEAVLSSEPALVATAPIPTVPISMALTSNARASNAPVEALVANTGSPALKSMKQIDRAPDEKSQAIAPEVRLAPMSMAPVDPPPSIAVLPSADASESLDPYSNLDWAAMQAMIKTNKDCPSCWLDKSILGAGDIHADWVFVSDAPGLNDVQEKQIFTGRAGQLFEAVLSALDLRRDMVYTTSVFKCAPPADLSVTPACNKLLQRQIELIAPKVVVTFGEFSAQAVLRANGALDLLRDSPQQCLISNALVVPTYSPAQMLDDNALKALVWSDLKKGLNLMASQH